MLDGEQQRPGQRDEGGGGGREQEGPGEQHGVEGAAGVGAGGEAGAGEALAARVHGGEQDHRPPGDVRVGQGGEHPRPGNARQGEQTAQSEQGDADEIHPGPRR